MRNHETNPEIQERRCRNVLRRPTFVIVGLGLFFVAASGCELGHSALPSQASVEIIRGKDSAGATIELEKRGDDLTAARVIDMVLGTGEAEIMSDEDGNVEFTIRFPAGATITYLGVIRDERLRSTLTVSGTWTQHSAGIFAEDAGTWQAPTNPEQQTRR